MRKKIFLKTNAVKKILVVSSGAATQGVLKKVFLKISLISEKHTCARVSFNEVAGVSLQLY